MRLADFITSSSAAIISDWEQFALQHVPAARLLDLDERRDHAAAMLKVVALDMTSPQTKREQADKSKGTEDGRVDAHTAATSHGSDRAATGYSPSEMVAEFRALRASVLRLWAESEPELDRRSLDDVTRFNEAIDQLLAESLGRFAHDVEGSKDLFLAVLGHDLRNPLGAIMMSASTMMAKEGADWPHARTVSRILSSGTRMDAMIRDLLDFARTRVGRGIPVVRAEMDLASVCRQAIDEISAFYPGCVVSFEATGDFGGEWDKDRIAQVLSNLVGNAYQHGTPETPVTVTLRGESDDVVLTVHNEAQAIEPMKLKDIFDPFRQLDAQRAKTKNLRSAGLGLYIAREIVASHDGSIAVASEEDGTTFTVRLPRRAAEGAPVGRPSSTPPSP
jgi:signal transduction histidine kinase